MPEKVLGVRKQQILRAVVEEHLLSALPVGSRVIARRYVTGVSPATIRNEMADLEEEGYLCQPYASAGRIPTDLGYRFYVDHLVRRSTLPSREAEEIRARLLQFGYDVETVLRQAIDLLSALSEYATVLVTPRLYRSVIKMVQLVVVNLQRILIVLLTNTGASQVLMDLSPDQAGTLDQADLIQISNLLTEQLSGKRVQDLHVQEVNRIAGTLPAYQEVLSDVLALLSSAMQRHDEERLYATGVANMLKQPEFGDSERMRQLMTVLEEEELLQDVFEQLEMTPRPVVQIGSEIPAESMRDFSVISVSFGEPSTLAGRLGIVGPTRMGYERSLALVDVMGGLLSEIVSDRFT